MKEIVEKNSASNDSEIQLREELAKSGGIIESVREKYRTKIDGLETFYGEKIAWLVSKVETLEKEKSKRGRRRQDDDEYDRPSSSDLLQPEEDENDENDPYYGDARLRRGRSNERGRTMARRNHQGIRNSNNRSTSRSRSKNISHSSIGTLKMLKS